MSEIQQAIDGYKEFLVAAQKQHQKTIDEANAQLAALIAATAKEERPIPKAQSAWVTGNDGERFLMLNEPATELLNEVFSKFKSIIELLAKEQER